MPDLSAYIDFTVLLDKSGDSPVIKVTDNGSYPDEVIQNIIGNVSITHPDKITISDAKTEYLGGAITTASSELRLSSNSAFQRGLYTITYTVSADGYDTTTKTKQFSIRYDRPAGKILESLDVFTPSLKVNDVTQYNQAGLAVSSVSRTWGATIENIGSLKKYDEVLDLLFQGEYWDAKYSVTLNAVVTWVMAGATWVSVRDKVTASKSFATEVPSSLEDLLTEINAKYTAVQGNCECEDSAAFNAYQKAFTLFSHLLLRGKYGSKFSLRTMIDDIQRVLNNGADPLYEVTNEAIKPYSFDDFMSVGSIKNNHAAIDIIIGISTNYKLSTDRRVITPLNKYGRPSLIGGSVNAFFLEGVKVPFVAREQSAYAYFNSDAGTITLTNGTFADGAAVSINPGVAVEETNTATNQGPFDTVITFASSVDQNAYGCGFHAQQLSSKLKFHFNKKLNTGGLDAVFRINQGGKTILLNNMPQDYLGEACAVTDEYGIYHTGLAIIDNTITL